MANYRLLPKVIGSRFTVTVNFDFAGIFFMFPEQHSVFLGLWVQNRLAYQKTRCTGYLSKEWRPSFIAFNLEP